MGRPAGLNWGSHLFQWNLFLVFFPAIGDRIPSFAFYSTSYGIVLMPIIHILGVFASNLYLVGPLVSLSGMGLSNSLAKTRPNFFQNIIYCSHYVQLVSLWDPPWRETTELTVGKWFSLNQLRPGKMDHRQVWSPSWTGRVIFNFVGRPLPWHHPTPHPHQLPSCTCLLLLLLHLLSSKAGWVQGLEPASSYLCPHQPMPVLFFVAWCFLYRVPRQ